MTILTPMLKPVNLFVVDGSVVYRAGLRTLLGGRMDICLCGEAATCEQAIDSLRRGIAVDLILVDSSLESEGDGVELISELRKEYPELKYIILTQSKDTQLIIRSLQVGVQGYISKDAALEEILNAIQTAMSGTGIYFGEYVSTDILLRAFGGEEGLASGKPLALSPRELEILKALASGYSVKRIVEEFGIAATTVDSYKERIKTKLGVDSIIEAAVLAVRLGLW